jgi:hypothetical protein
MDEKVIYKGSSTLGASLQETIPQETIPVETKPVEAELNEEKPIDNLIPVPEVKEEIIDKPVAEVTEPVEEENESSFAFPFEEEAKPTETTPATQQPITDWKTAIKSVDRKELLKELGINDFAIELNEYISKGGQAADYITAKGFDWTKIPDADLVKNSLRQEFPDATPAQIERRFNKLYDQDSLIDEDKEDGLLLMKSEARKIREKEIAKQQSFKMPESIKPEENPEYVNWKKGNDELAQKREAFKIQLANDEATKSLFENKRVGIKVGKNGETFYHKIDKPEVLMTALTDGGQIWKKLLNNEKGEPNILKQQQIILFAADPEGYAERIFNFGKSQGIKSKVEENRNS